MAGRKIADESEARKALAAIAKSGAGIRSWARAHGIDGRSLHAWEMALARRGTSTREAGLIELVPAYSSAPSRYVMRIADVTVEFGDDAREETLRRLVSVLRAC